METSLIQLSLNFLKDSGDANAANKTVLTLASNVNLSLLGYILLGNELHILSNVVAFCPK